MNVDSMEELQIQAPHPSGKQCAPSPAPVGCCRCSLAQNSCAVAMGMFGMVPVWFMGPSSASRFLHNCLLCSGNSCQKEHKRSLAPYLTSTSSHITKNLIKIWDQCDRIICVVQAAFLRVHLSALLYPAQPCGQPALPPQGRG